MRITSWIDKLNTEATVKAYIDAVESDAVNLAHNIKEANPTIVWAIVDRKLHLHKLETARNRSKDAGIEAPETV